MPLSSQELKDRTDLTEADRPYRVGEERADKMRGLVGLGRSQSRGTQGPSVDERQAQIGDQGGPTPPMGTPDGEAPPMRPRPGGDLVRSGIQGGGVAQRLAGGPGGGLDVEFDDPGPSDQIPEWPRDVIAISQPDKPSHGPREADPQDPTFGQKLEKAFGVATDYMLHKPQTQAVLRFVGAGNSALDILTVHADAAIPGEGQGTLHDRFQHYLDAGLAWDVAANATMRDYGDALGQLAEDPNAPGAARTAAQGARAIGTVQSLTAPAPVPGGAQVAGFGLIAGTFRRVTAAETRRMLAQAAAAEGVAARLEAIGMKAEAAQATKEAQALRESADVAQLPPKPKRVVDTGDPNTPERKAAVEALAGKSTAPPPGPARDIPPELEKVPGETPTEYRPETQARDKATTSEGDPLLSPRRGGTEQPAGAGKSAPATAGIRYPTEENLGLAKGLLQSLPENLRNDLMDDARRIYPEIQEARGGVVPLSQVERESERLLLDAGIIAQASPRTPLNAPGMRVVLSGIARVKAEHKAMQDEARKIGRAGIDDEFRIRYMAKTFELNSLTRLAAGARAEWGRVGQQLQSAIGDPSRVRLVNTRKMLERALGGNATVDQVIERLQSIADDPMLAGDPWAVERAQLKAIHASVRPGFWEKMRTGFVAGILSIARTHEVYVMAQGANYVADMISRYGTAAIDPLVAKLEGRTQVYSMAEAIAASMSQRHAVGRGLLAAWDTLRTGVAPEQARLFGETGLFRPSVRGALESGKGPLTEKLIDANVPVLSGLARAVPSGADVLTADLRLISSYTAAFHESAAYTKLSELAAGAVKKEMPNSTPLEREFRRRMQVEMDEVADRHPEWLEIMRREGQRASFRNEDPNIIAKGLRMIRDAEVPKTVPVLGGARPLYRFFPFVNIGFNTVSRGIEYSPLGFARAVATKGPERSAAIARAGLGSMIFFYFWNKADAGEMSGALPDDPNEAALWHREGKTPYSMQEDGVWYPIDRWEGVGTQLKWMAGLNAAKKDAERDIAKGTPLQKAIIDTAAMKALTAIGHATSDMTFFMGIGQIVRGAKIASREGLAAGVGDVFGQQLVSQVPFSGSFRKLAQGIDPLVRSPRGLEQQIEAAIPGLSTLVPASQDVYGEAVRRPPAQQGIRSLIDPFQGSPEHKDPVDEELMKHQIPSDDPTNPGGARQIFASNTQKVIDHFKLTGEEGQALRTLAGRGMHQQLSDLFAGKTDHRGKKFADLPEPEKVKAIQKVMANARAVARGVVADAILHQATTAPEAARAVDMRLSLLHGRWERAIYLEATSRMPQWTAQASKLVNDRLKKQKGQPTVEEYLRAAPLVRAYLAAPPFDRLDPEQTQRLEQQKRDLSDIRTRDRLDGTKNADAYIRSHAILARYENEPVSNARARIIDQARRQKIDLAAYVGGARYVRMAP